MDCLQVAVKFLHCRVLIFAFIKLKNIIAKNTSRLKHFLVKFWTLFCRHDEWRIVPVITRRRFFFAGGLFRVFGRDSNNCNFDSSVINTNVPQFFFGVGV